MQDVVISIGGGIRWASENQIYKQFQPLGLSKKAFRAWMANLQIPYIEIGKHRIYQLNQILMALNAISRIGQKPFLVPGCAGMKNRKPGDTRTTRHLDMDDFKKNHKLILTELLAARKMVGVKINKQVRTAAETAANRMMHAVAVQMPSAQQAAFMEELELPYTGAYNEQSG